MRGVFRFLGGLLAVLFAAFLTAVPPAERLGWAVSLVPLGILFGTYAVAGPRAVGRLVDAVCGGLGPPHNPPRPDR